jgi:hypothetical protein
MIRHEATKRTWRQRACDRWEDWVWAYEAWKRGDVEWRWEILNRTPEMTDADYPTVPLDEEKDGNG